MIHFKLISCLERRKLTRKCFSIKRGKGASPAASKASPQSASKKKEKKKKSKKLEHVDGNLFGIQIS
jgi:hypothetical protein